MLHLVPTPIGNLNDISKRSIDTLFSADVILCEDTRVTAKLLTLLKERYNQDPYKAKLTSMHSHNEDDVISNLDNAFFAQEVVYVSDAGMPGISDPGHKLIQHCLANNIAYTVLPGASALLVGYVASGLGHTQFVFGGFLPHKQENRLRALHELVATKQAVVLFESPHRLLDLLTLISQTYENSTVFLAKELSKLHETFFKGSAKELLKVLKTQTIKGEWVVVIDKIKTAKSITLFEDEILKLDMPPKAKAKLLAKLGKHDIKTWYNILQKGQ